MAEELSSADSEEVRRVVEAVVRKYLQRNGVEVVGESCGLPAGTGKPVVALFTGAVQTLDSALRQMASLAPRNVALTAVLSHSAAELIGEARLAARGCFDSLCSPADHATAGEAVKACSLLAVPTLTVNTVAKVALGMPDSLPAQLIVQALAQGTPVVAAADGADPRSRAWLFPGLAENAPSLAELFRERLNAFQRHGVRLVPTAELCDACLEALNDPTGKNLRASANTRAIITAEDVEQAADRGHLRVGPDAIVTHAAQERAAELGVELAE